MTNQDVIEMVSLSLADDVIIEKLQSVSKTDFDTSVIGLRALKAGKVSDAVIRVMINPASETRTLATNEAAARPEVGVYIVRDGRQSDVPPEIVNWRTGGVLKTEATLGLVKGDVNGKLMKGKSSTQTTSPLEFLIRTPEGSSVEEYQLLRLHEKSNRREFRCVTGGILHISGGAERDEIAFRSAKIGNRTWKILIADLPKGEYGFLPPGLTSSSISASGKMFTFGIIEGSQPQEARSGGKRNDPSSAGSPTKRAPSGSMVTITSLGVTTSAREDQSGVELTQIASGSVAELAGLKVGNVIKSVDGRPVGNVTELEGALVDRSSGEKIRLTYMFRTNLGWMPGPEKVLVLP